MPAAASAPCVCHDAQGPGSSDQQEAAWGPDSRAAQLLASPPTELLASSRDWRSQDRKPRGQEGRALRVLLSSPLSRFHKKVRRASRQPGPPRGRAGATGGSRSPAWVTRRLWTNRSWTPAPATRRQTGHGLTRGRDGGLGDGSLPDLVPLRLTPGAPGPREPPPSTRQRNALPRAVKPPHRVARTVERDSKSQGEGTREHAQLGSDLSATSNGSLGGTWRWGEASGVDQRGCPWQMEMTWSRCEQFVRCRLLEGEKEAVQTARRGPHRSRAHCDGRLVCGERAAGPRAPRGGCRRATHRGRLPWRGRALNKPQLTLEPRREGCRRPWGGNPMCKL